MLRHLFDDAPANLRGKVIGIYGILFTFNAAAWLWAIVAFRHYPLLLGTALLAYSFGLRHAVDADHIAAIDNVTRKLMQEGKRPVGIGFMFSLGHSTIVVLGSAAIAATALALQHRMDGARVVGGVIGTLVSALFLFGIAAVNIVVLTLDLSRFRAGAQRRALRRRGFRHAARQPRISCAALPAHVRHDPAQLAHVSAGRAVRAGLRYRDRDRAAGHLRGRSVKGTAVVVDHGVSRRCSPRACR